ncbi:Liver carboxylesterase 2 [Phytophthora cinnamomi]|uniref:Liver carboxylesterase 2 n=1 Tax=Phytophthora cinnamomi TaxID=4785 RepID=UPI0035599763|nr:Liver carboxylesterase 2 [Phytophthora cinnamomi]
MRRLSLTAMPSRRQKQQQRASLSSACGKSTSSLRSTFGNFSMLSSLSGSLSSDSLTSLSTASSSYGGFMEDYDDVDEELEDQECCEQGWMYWKKDADCWLKMYAHLRNELLWLSKGADDVVAVVQIAVAGVRTTNIGSVIARGPSGESMELFPYERERTREWIDALYVAAQLTQSYERSVAAESAETEMPHREIKEVEQVYTGTLVIYNAEQKKSPWKHFLSAKRLRDACRRRIEKFVDRLDTSKR